MFLWRGGTWSLVGIKGLFLLIQVRRVHKLHLIKSHIAVHILILIVGQTKNVEILIVLLLLFMQFLLADKLVEPILIHIGHQLLEDLRIIESHILQELWKLIDWDGHHVSGFPWYLNELYRLRPIHIASSASILITKASFDHSAIYIV